MQDETPEALWLPMMFAVLAVNGGIRGKSYWAII